MVEDRPGRMILRVQTFILHDDRESELESTFHINLYKHEGRVRLARHSWWAAHNGRSVLTLAERD